MIDKKMTLKQYYATKHWKEFRQAITIDKKCECQICGLPRWNKYKNKKVWNEETKTYDSVYKKPKRIEIHHKTYDTLGEESRCDVIALCPNCHKFMHMMEMMSRTRSGFFQAIYEFMLVNTEWGYKKR